MAIIFGCTYPVAIHLKSLCRSAIAVQPIATELMKLHTVLMLFSLLVVGSSGAGSDDGDDAGGEGGDGGDDKKKEPDPEPRPLEKSKLGRTPYEYLSKAQLARLLTMAMEANGGHEKTHAVQLALYNSLRIASTGDRGLKRMLHESTKDAKKARTNASCQASGSTGIPIAFAKASSHSSGSGNGNGGLASGSGSGSGSCPASGSTSCLCGLIPSHAPFGNGGQASGSGSGSGNGGQATGSGSGNSNGGQVSGNAGGTYWVWVDGFWQYDHQTPCPWWHDCSWCWVPGFWHEV